MKDAWLVVECVPESLKLKRDVVADLDALTSSETIIASNSSSFTISEIVEGLELKHCERMASLHSCLFSSFPGDGMGPSMAQTDLLIT